MTEAHPLPFEQSYWVLPAQLLAGPYPGSRQPGPAEPRLRALLAAGIRRVISLVEPEEDSGQEHALYPYQETLQRFAAELDAPLVLSRYPIPDGSIPSRATMRAILDEIDAALAAGQPVYVHCWGGKGRTGTVIGCYLARHGLASGAQALERINQLRSAITPFDPSPENQDQCRMVATWQKGD